MASMFIQGVISLRCATLPQLEALVERVNRECATNADLAEHCESANSLLDPFSMAIERFTDQEGAVWYSLANTQMDDFSKLASSLTPREIEAFKAIIASLVVRGRLTVDQEIKGIVALLCQRFWLQERLNSVVLGPRTMTELAQYLQDTFPEQTSICALCRTLAIGALRCSTCRTPTHAHCSEKLHNSTSARLPKCPFCA